MFLNLTISIYRFIFEYYTEMIPGCDTGMQERYDTIAIN